MLLAPKANLFGGNGVHRGIGEVIVAQVKGKALSEMTRNQAQVIKLSGPDLAVVVVGNVVVSYWRDQAAGRIERVIQRLKNLAHG